METQDRSRRPRLESRRMLPLPPEQPGMWKGIDCSSDGPRRDGTGIAVGTTAPTGKH